MLPPDLKIPMVAPGDLGKAAAARLVEPFSRDIDNHLVEGPQRYSARDVAHTFAKVLDRPVNVVALPPDRWKEAYRKLGFSTAYARMTEATVNGEFPSLEDTEHGSTSLEAYFQVLVQNS